MIMLAEISWVSRELYLEYQNNKHLGGRVVGTDGRMDEHLREPVNAENMYFW